MEAPIIKTKVTIDDVTYTLDEGGNVIDGEGTVFKTSDEYTEYLKADDEGTDDNDKKVVIDEVEYKLDDKGNALSEDGTVLKTAEELKDLIVEDEDENQIEIDDVIYKVNENGDAVNDKGEVFKTKAEIDELIAADDTTPSTYNVSKLMTSTGIEVKDEAGAVINYENNESGIAAYVKDSYTQGVAIGSQKGIEDLYAINPLIKDFVEHIKLTGNAEDFNKTTSYSTMSVDDKNEDSMIALIRAERKAKGDNEAQITQTVTWSKNANELAATAKNSLSYLQNKEKEEGTEREQALKIKEQEEANVLTENITSINKVLKDGKLVVGENEITIPKVLKIRLGDGKVRDMESDIIIDYITTKRKFNIEGKEEIMTGFEAAEKMEKLSMSVENKILSSIRRLTGVSADELITRKINSNAVKTIKKLSTKKAPTSKKQVTTVGKKGIIIPSHLVQ